MARLMWVLSLLATLALSATAASSSPPPSSVNCDSVLIDMIDCLSYVSKGSNLSQPDKVCCQGVSNVVKTSPTCLCAALQQAIRMGVDLDIKRVAGLPAACSIKVSVGDCGVKSPPPSAPGPAPSPMPTPAPPSPPKSSPTPPPPPPPKPTPSPPSAPKSPPTPSPTLTPTRSPTLTPTPLSPASPPKSSAPPSPSVAPTIPAGPSPPPAPAPVESQPADESSTCRRLPIPIMTAMIALVVASFSYLEL